ncbi:MULTISPECIES: hypothetical protein [Bacteroidaceae]|uniref:hypothetical protein n=1 Tax=Bacteroidaceae TaxID=815 RepID=UPI001F2E0C06|nr:MULTISPECIES: hypothetical protein [Bacteroidaceae]
MTVSRRASVPLTERVDGFLEEHTSEVKDIREEDRSAMSSSQEDRQKHPEIIAKNRKHEKASVLESDVKWKYFIYTILMN